MTDTEEATTHSDRGGRILVVSQFVSRLLGLLRDTAMTYRFGIGLETDLYGIAFTIPDAIFMLVAGGGLSSAFIPVFAELYYTDRRKEAWKVFSVIVTFCSLCVVALIGAAWFFAPQIVAFMSMGKKVTENGIRVPIRPEHIERAAYLGRIVLPAQFAFVVGSLLLATLYARKRFMAPGFAPNVYNLGIIVGALAIPPLFHTGIEGMAFGALVGAIVGNLLLPLAAMAKDGFEFTPSLDLRAPGVAKFFRLLGPVIFGFSLPSMALLISQKFASHYPLGSNTVIKFANTLMQAPQGVFGQSLALAAFPVLAQFFAQNRMDLYRTQIVRTMNTVLYLSIPASVVLYVLAPQIVSLIYGYGQGADPAQLHQVVVCLRVYALAVAPWCLQPVLMRGFFSMHRTLVPVVLSTAMSVLFIVLCYVWGPIGVTSIPWASNVAATLLMVVLYMALTFSVGALSGWSLLKTSLKCLLASAVMGGAAYGLGLLIPTHMGKAGMFLVFTLACAALGWFYFWLTVMAKMPEADLIRRALQKKRSGRATASGPRDVS